MSQASPAISVILPTVGDFGSITRTVRAIRAQTIRDSIELVIISPSGILDIPEEEVSGLARVMVVRGGDLTSSNRARLIGIRAATAPIVVLSEDHCFPEPDWAEALLDSHVEKRAVVGPAMRNGNPTSMLSWSNFLLEYAEWQEPTPGGLQSEVPGHNSAYKRDLLLAYGADLDRLFEIEGVIQRDLARKGYQLWVEPAARTNHLNFSRWGPSLDLRLHASRNYAGYRRQEFSAVRRAAYIVGAPLIPLVRLIRICRLVGNSPHRSLLPRVIPALIVNLVVSAFGEFLGYLAGPGSSTDYLGQIEFDRLRFMSESDRREYARQIAATAVTTALPEDAALSASSVA